MSQIGYRQWGLIPVDPDPLTGQVLAPRPPMMTAVALDKDASLVFRLSQTPAQLLIQAEVTALSGEGRCLPLLQVFTGTAPDQFHPLESSPWEKTQEGLYLLFSTQVRAPEQYLKLRSVQDPSLIVNHVLFSTP